VANGIKDGKQKAQALNVIAAERSKATAQSGWGGQGPPDSGRQAIQDAEKNRRPSSKNICSADIAADLAAEGDVPAGTLGF